MFHRTERPKMFIGWFPEININLFKHFKVISIRIVVENRDNGEPMRFEYDRNPPYVSPRRLLD